MTSPQPAETRTQKRSAQTATLAEIAREAGVSAPTVSKVLNGRADVAPSTRARVEELLRTHGYRRRRAESTRSPLIDLVFHELESAWAMEVIRGVENVARDAGLSVVLSESAGRLTPGRTWADQVAARRPHGVILVLSGLDESQRALLTSGGRTAPRRRPAWSWPPAWRCAAARRRPGRAGTSRDERISPQSENFRRSPTHLFQFQ